MDPALLDDCRKYLEAHDIADPALVDSCMAEMTGIVDWRAADPLRPRNDQPISAATMLMRLLNARLVGDLVI